MVVRGKKLFLVFFVFSAVSASATAQGLTLFDDSDLNANGNNISNVSNIENFFDQSQCASDEAIKTVYPNGSYACNTISSTTSGPENLSETLTAGNVANQSIGFARDANVEIGGNNLANNMSLAIGKNAEADGGTFSGAYGNETAVGTNATAKGVTSTALGYDASSGGEFSTGLGAYATASAIDSTAVGRGADATGQRSSAFGQSSEASAADATALGRGATVSKSGGSAFGKGSTASGSNSVALGRSSTASGLNSVSLGYSSSADQGGVALGHDTDAGTNSVEPSIALGRSADASWNRGIAIGPYSQSLRGRTIALGYDTEASGGLGATSIGYKADASQPRSVAIGYFATAPNKNEATFGSFGTGDFGNDLELDVNVTGNLTVHGSGGINMQQGIEIGDTSTNTNNNTDIAIGHGAQADAPYKFVYGNETAIGADAKATGTDATALGYQAQASKEDAVALGYNSEATGLRAVALGDSSNASGSDAVALGPFSTASDLRAVALGQYSNASQDNGVAIGQFSKASGSDAVALSPGSKASKAGAVAIGHDSVSAQSSTARFGSDSTPYDVEVTGDLQVDGSLTGVSTSGGSTENLSETLTAGNVANQTIKMQDETLSFNNYNIYSGTGIQIGDSSTSTAYGNAVAIGKDASASGERSIALGLDSSTSDNGASALGWGSSVSGIRSSAIGNAADAAGDTAFAGGFDASASGFSSVALGDKSEASNRGSITIGERAGYNTMEGKGAIAIGSNIEPNAGATAAGNYAISVGRAASASSEGSVAIGPNTTAPNSYEATFGNLNGQELDVNVTGNLTVHGSDGIILETMSSGGMEIGDDNTETDTSSALAVGSEAKAYDSDGVSGHNNVALGNGATADGTNYATAVGGLATASGNSVALGGAADSGYFGVSIGRESQAVGSGVALGGVSTTNGESISDAASAAAGATALGASSDATAEGAVSIGSNANAPNSYEATFGNLNGEELDVNVTGNATIHGSGGLDMPNGVVIGNPSSSSDGSGDVVLGQGAKASGGNIETAVGDKATASGYDSVALGKSSTASFDSALAVGAESTASGITSSAVGHKSTASGTGSVALGYKSNSPNNYEATFGNLNGEELDVNVTGNLTVHDNLEIKGDCTGCGGGGSSTKENLSTTLAAGNVANQSIRMNGNSILMSSYRLTDGGQGIQIGDSSTSTGDSDALAIGGSASASGFDAVAIGQSGTASDGDAVAIGSSSEASGPDSVAIGRFSEAFQDNTMAIGDSSTASNDDAVAIGPTSSAFGQDSAALGSSSEASSSDSVAIGRFSEASNDNAVTIGRYTGQSSTEGKNAVLIGADPGGPDSPGGVATGDDSIGLGANVSATANGAVAIGNNSKAVNPNEATFGNLNGQELDVNVTGNLTVHQKIFGESGTNVTVGQDLKVEGDVYSTGADLAEIYSSHQELEKGELVMLSDVKDVERTESEESDPVGVVSTNPGSVLNADQSGHPIALEGKVPVKVDGMVEEGDHLVPSKTPGVATSCETGSPTKALNSNSSTGEIVDAVKDLESDQECLKDSIGVAMEDGRFKVDVKLD